MEHTNEYKIATALIEKEDEKFDTKRIKLLRKTIEQHTGKVYYRKNSSLNYESEVYWVVVGFYDNWHADVIKWSYDLNKEHVSKNQREYIRYEVQRSNEYIYHEKYECMSSKQNFWDEMEIANPEKFKEFQTMVKKKLQIR
jgi:hypothetical protein